MPSNNKHSAPEEVGPVSEDLYPHPAPNGWPFPVWLPYKYKPEPRPTTSNDEAPF